MSLTFSEKVKFIFVCFFFLARKGNMHSMWVQWVHGVITPNYVGTYVGTKCPLCGYMA